MRLLQQSFAFLWFFVCTNSLYAQTNDITLAVWANEAIVSTYTYNASNFLSRQKEIAHYFTATGWINFSKALQASKLPETIKKNNYTVSAVALMPPSIKTIRTNQWQAIMPILVVYQNPSFQQQQTLEVILNFTQAPQNQGVRGLIISSIQTKITKPPCQCQRSEA